MLGKVLLVLRAVGSWVAAAGLMLTLAYPDRLIPDTPEAYCTPGITPMLLKPYMWLLPLLVLEAFSSLGPHRNRLYFGALLGVFIPGLLAWPVLQAHWPELASPTFAYEDGKLTFALLCMLALLVCSVVFRLVILNYMLYYRVGVREDVAGSVEASVLDPAKGRTVQEIAADPRRVQPNFRFGPADESLIDRFTALMRRMLRLYTLRCYALCGFCLFCLLWLLLYPRPNAEEAFRRDLARMYDTYTPRPGLCVATEPALHAAVRVFRRIDAEQSLCGLQAEEALRRLRVPKGYATAGVRTVRPMDSEPLLTVAAGPRAVALYAYINEEDGSITTVSCMENGWNLLRDAQLQRTLQGLPPLTRPRADAPSPFLPPRQ